MSLPLENHGREWQHELGQGRHQKVGESVRTLVCYLELTI